MKAPLFDVEIPDGTTAITDYHPAPPSRRSVACINSLIPEGAAHLPTAREEGWRQAFRQTLDDNFATLVRLFVKGGVKLFCTEGLDADQVGGLPFDWRVMQLFRFEITTALSPVSGSPCDSRLREVLRGVQRPTTENADGPRLIGVDHLEWLLSMRLVLRDARVTWPADERLFALLGEALEGVLRRRPAGPATELLRLYWRHQCEAVTLSEVSGGLLRLARQAGVVPPAEVHRALVGMHRFVDRGAEALEQEIAELPLRLKQAIKSGLLDPGMVTTFRAREQEARPDERDEPRVGPTALGRRRLQRHELRRLRYAKNLTEGVMDKTDVMTRQRHSTKRSGGDYNAQVKNIVTTAEAMERYYTAARLLGIDISCYPNLCAEAEACRLLEPLTGEAFEHKLLDAFDAAWSFSARALCQAPAEKELYEACRRYTLLRRLACLKMTPEDYAEMVEDRAGCWLQSVVAVAAAAGGPVSRDLAGRARDFDERRNAYMSFYTLARRRGARMAAETLRHMETLVIDKAVLLCLGFHQWAVKAVLEEADVPYVAIRPHFPL